jgi:hypothetical protein
MTAEVMETFPNDADGDALRDLARRADLSKPMKIDFAVVVPDEQSGKAMADKARAHGYDPALDFDDESETWTCYCTKRMVPTYQGVVAAQAELDSLSSSLGGHCDGWGTFGH